MALGMALTACGRLDLTEPPDLSPGSVTISGGPTVVRQGDVTAYSAEATGAAASAGISWSLLPTDAGFVAPDGRFVGYLPGAVRLIARAETVADTLVVEVQPRGIQPSTFTVAGHGEVVERFTSDLWVFGDAAYTGTWSVRTTDESRSGNRLYVWDVSEPAAPVLTDSISVDARTVNDVKIRSDGALAVLTHEGSADGQNGITLLELSDPQHPTVVVRYSMDLTPGVHNVWIDGDQVYAVVDGSSPAIGSGLAVIDIVDPAAPETVATFWGGSSFLHDVYVRDGLAFLSHWDAGLIILDVGNGVAGGSPDQPVEVGRTAIDGGNAHNAWYWPATGYVFVGDEYGERRAMHVVDATDLRNPREVAIYLVPGETPHNFWLDEERGILFAAWYTQGLRAIDVTGELLGELHRQGREVAASMYGGIGGCQSTPDRTCTWAPQLHEGEVYLSDLNSGLWILRPEF